LRAVAATEAVELADPFWIVPLPDGIAGSILGSSATEFPVWDNTRPFVAELRLTKKKTTTEQLVEELRNFQDIARHLKPSPGEIPRLEGIDIASLSMPLTEVIGGDHLIYIDFDNRYNLERRLTRARRQERLEVVAKLEELRTKAGILVADVSGHRMTDAVIAAMLHQAFLLGVYYELDRYGEITTRIFEHLNTRFYATTAVNKFFTMLYGEIAVGGRFRFISAGHQPPAVFSREYGRFADIHPDRLVSFPPVGLLPPSDDPDDAFPEKPLLTGKKRYEVNEISLLSPGDILLLFTDGLAEHDKGRFYPDAVEAALRDCPGCTSTEICKRLEATILQRAEPEDDITVVVIRRTL
jgi:serine phosphatase RsbU (regulator of sigma subunit)